MAAVVLTFDFSTLRSRDVAGVRRRQLLIGTIGTPNNNYATGGITIPPAQVGLGVIEAIIPCGPMVNGTNALTPYWNRATGKLMLFWGGAVVSLPEAEVANATDVSSYVGTFEILGR